MEAPTSPDLDSASVAITVSPLVPVSGKGDIRYIATVQLDIGGVEVTTHGWTLRVKQNRMHVFLPAYRDPRTGEWEAAVELPGDLLQAVGMALLEQLPGDPMVFRLPAVDARANA